MSSAHTKAAAVGILGLQAGEDVNKLASSLAEICLLILSVRF